MSDRKTSKEIQAEIDALTDQLAATLMLEIADLTRQAEEGEAKYQALLRKMVGRRIVITKKDDPLCGMEAVITGPRRSPCIGGSELQLGSKHTKQRPVSSSCHWSLHPNRHNRSLLGKQNSNVKPRVMSSQQSSASRCRLWQPQHVPTKVYFGYDRLHDR